MKRFNMSVAKIKNSKGVYESIPALRDRSGYETAKANGYTGTESEWLNDIYSDGWVTACQELDSKKADKDAVENNAKDITNIYTLVPPWNLDRNVGKIYIPFEDRSYGVEVRSYANSDNTLFGVQVNGISIPIINNGDIRVKFTDYISRYDAPYFEPYPCSPANTFIKWYLNEQVLYEQYAPENNSEGSDSTVVVRTERYLDITVKKGDVLSCIVSAETIPPNGSGSANAFTTSVVVDIGLYANIETPFKYIDLTDAYLEDPSTTEILNRLLGGAN